jgi:hypothetical protein
MSKKILFFLLATVSFNQMYARQDLSLLPAITFEIHNKGLIKTKYSKIHSETNYGLWVALDHQNDSLHYKIVQEDGKPSMINVKDISRKIIEEIKFYEPTIKEYLKEIVDFQVAKRYFLLLKNYFSDVPMPRLGDISAKILQHCQYYDVKDNEIYSEITLYHKTIRKNYEKLESYINIIQKTLGLSPQNKDAINNAYNTAKKYLDEIQYSHDNTPFSYNYGGLTYSCIPHFIQSVTPSCSNWLSDSNLTTFQCATINSFAIKKIIEKPHSTTEIDTVIGAFAYLPPVPEQYGSVDNCKTFGEKIDELGDFLKQNKQGELLLPDAKEKIKEKADEAVSKIIDEIRNLQTVANREIEKIVEKIKNIF